MYVQKAKESNIKKKHTHKQRLKMSVVGPGTNDSAG